METKMKDTGIEWIGKIPEVWDVFPTKALFEIYAGSTPDTDNINYWDGDIPWVTPADFKTQDIYIDHGHSNITEEGLRSCSTVFLPAGTLIFSKRAPIGQAGISARPMCTNQGCFSCVIKNGNDVKYFFYQVSAFQQIYEMFGAGTTFKEISGFNFSNFKLIRPSLEEQKIIASFLDSKCSKIDKMISDAESQIEVLENHKKSLITETITHGLDKSVPLKDTGIEWIGKIPENWNIKKIKYIANLEGRIGWEGLTSDEYTDEGPYLITGIDFVDGKIDWEHCVHISEERWKIGKSVQIHEGDLLITKDGTVGKVAVADNLHEKASLNSGVLLIAPFDGLLRRYFFWVLKSEVFWEWFSLDNAGNSTIIHLYQNAFENFSFPLPNIEEQREIYEYLDSKCSKIDKMIQKQKKAVDTLKQYKKSLIYEYVTGKKRVEE